MQISYNTVVPYIGIIKIKGFWPYIISQNQLLTYLLTRSPTHPLTHSLTHLLTNAFRVA